ncbi:hypothetical protein ACGFXC_37045 [Streptomyces sp. NPDC048507]|uniref:nucleotide-binding protein n=1 Tax=Streptomyces sp. NPDC048507 TaxID=3365560 RepID=UPI003723E930
MTTSPLLPAGGRRIAFVGKGGSGKTTTIAHVLAHLAKQGVPAVGMDADKPGDEEDGSLYVWASAVDIGAPVYPAPALPRIADEAQRLTPPHGLGLLDTGAWERREGSPHLAVLSAVDLVVLCLPPTRMEMERAGSVLGALEHLRSVGAHAPRLVVLQTLVNASARSAGTTREALEGAGFTVLSTVVPRNDAHDGYAQAFGRAPRLVPGSPMDLLTAELLAVVAG